MKIERPTDTPYEIAQQRSIGRLAAEVYQGALEGGMEPHEALEVAKAVISTAILSALATPKENSNES